MTTISRLHGGRRIDPLVALLLLPLLVLLAVCFVYPLALMVQRTFTDFSGPHESGFDNYRWFFATNVNITVLGRTLLTALAVTAICVVVAYPYAYAMTRVSGRMRIVMVTVVLMPFWTSLMVRNYAWIVLLQPDGPVNRILGALGLGRVELLGHASGVALAMCQILLPFMVLPLYSALRTIDASLMPAARSLGAPPRRAFTRVYLPLSMPGIVAGSLLVFVLSLGFYITPALLGSPQQSLLSQLIAVEVGRLSEFGRGASMAVVLLLATLIVLGVGALLSRRSAAYANAVRGRAT